MRNINYHGKRGTNPQGGLRLPEGARKPIYRPDQRVSGGREDNYGGENEVGGEARRNVWEGTRVVKLGGFKGP
ncbi:MAG: hypothetical protein ABH864_07460 [archaeon]